MAIDHGTRRIGIALCDPEETVVTPYAVWPNDERTILRISALAREEAVEAVVIGLPRHDDGSESATAGTVRRFAEELKAELPAGIPVRFWGEALTTIEAARRLDELHGGPGGAAKNRRKTLDAVAAAVILEDLIAARRERKIPPGSIEI
jgi:putative Holliday junction resolvase